MKKKIKLLIVALAMFFGGCVAVAPASAQVLGKVDILEVIEVNGAIGGYTATHLANKVDEISLNPNVKAVLLVIDSPGGGLSASGAAFEEVSKLKVPVVVWCTSVCASGGVWISMAPSVKFIAVRAHTVGGSVGVVATLTRYNRLLDYLKVDNETFKSGELKDVGNPTRAAQDAERAYVQGIVTNSAAQFYALVAKARGTKITPAAWVEIKTAAVFTGKEIVRVGLADAVMTKEEVYAKAKSLSGSSAIYAREELKKMSAAAEHRPGMGMQAPAAPGGLAGLGDVSALIEIAKEIRAGESIVFEARLPYRF